MNSHPIRLSAVTIAVGKEYYLNLAKNLLRSFLLWNNDNEIHFLLLTDNREYFNQFFAEPKVTIKNISLPEQEKSFTSKFLLFEHIIADENLFIDCDCLIYKDLRPLFKKFEGSDFSVVGECIQSGDFFCDVSKIMGKFSLSYLPKFVGSIYYFKRNKVTESIFEFAKKLRDNYDQHGFIRLRGKQNEEPLFATAMAKYHQHPVEDDGTIKADAMFVDQFNCDVRFGKAILRLQKPLKTTNSCDVDPAIVHYNDRFSEMETYLSEQFKLQTDFPSALRNLIATLRYSLPALFLNQLKNTLRPLYHRTLGPSKIQPIKRLTENKELLIFYEEPDPDRWFKYDRYLRKIIRRIVRGKPNPGGVMMVALELMRGLDKLKIPYRFNDYHYAKKNPKLLIGVIGKPHLIFEEKFANPIVFGAGVFSHPMECPDLFERYPNIQKILVPGDWMESMFKPYYGEKVSHWPVGIDTDHWKPNQSDTKSIDFLIYDKVRWKRDEFEGSLINPIIKILSAQGCSYQTIKYGSYRPHDLEHKLSVCKSVIFLCEHETQGIAYQQMLSTNTPILAWDRGGFWQDPNYYPEHVAYQPVSSVPYWEDRCGIKFMDAQDFETQLPNFLKKLTDGSFSPRSYILETLSSEICAKKYVDLMKEVDESLTNR